MRKLLPWLGDSLKSLQRASLDNRLGHGWLICGSRGVGKINLTVAFADWLARGRREIADLPAPSPQEVAQAMQARHDPCDLHPDLHWIFPPEDKIAIGVEHVRQVIADLSLTSLKGNAKVVVIEPAEAMTTAAANALLKTLEEPQQESYLLLVSHTPSLLPATIRSRCQKLLVAGPSNSQLSSWLARDRTDGPSLIRLGAEFDLSPLDLASALHGDDLEKLRECSADLGGIVGGHVDPMSIADKWAKAGNIDLALGCITACLRRVLRARCGGRASTPVTESPPDTSHNEWAKLTLPALFKQMDDAERLRTQLGTGINVELALRVLLLGFRPDRGAI